MRFLLASVLSELLMSEPVSEMEMKRGKRFLATLVQLQPTTSEINSREETTTGEPESNRKVTTEATTENVTTGGNTKEGRFEEEEPVDLIENIRPTVSSVHLDWTPHWGGKWLTFPGHGVERFWHSSNETRNWAEVELPCKSYVAKIKVVNRSDGRFPELLRNVKVLVDDHQCGDLIHGTKSGDVHWRTCGFYGSTIKLQQVLETPGYLYVHAMQAFGYKNCTRDVEEEVNKTEKKLGESTTEDPGQFPHRRSVGDLATISTTPGTTTTSTNSRIQEETMSTGKSPPCNAHDGGGVSPSLASSLGTDSSGK